VPAISGSISVGANATSTNQAAGTLEEFVTRPSYVRFLAATSAAGLNATLIVGRTALMNDQGLSFVGTSLPIPDSVQVEHAVNRGRLVLTLRNTTAGALTGTWKIDVVPLR
jgi:hypothetical protein